MRFVFDTSVLIDYLRDEHGDGIAADAFLTASEYGDSILTIISVMELFNPIQEEAESQTKPKTRKNIDIEKDLKRVIDITEKYKIRLIACPCEAQLIAVYDILKHHRSDLGTNALTDSLIIATGLFLGASLVTRDLAWKKVSKERKKKGLSELKVIDPVDLVQGRF